MENISRHLQVLKENMNRLSMELGPEYRAEELLALAISAKNNMHNIRGYSPNQWAFGQNHNRISSFLQQYQNLSLQGSRDIPTFEEQVQLEEKAQRLFLQVDSRRRISRAMHAKMRPLKEFVVGDLVYYFRKGVKEGSRYGGHWHGPARVLSHEKTSDFDDSQHAGSIVWITHAGRLVRCSPEQLRHVEHDLRHVDKKINGPQNFHTMLEQISNQQKYLDLSHEDWKSVPIWGSPEEMQPHFRSRGKQSLSELRRSPVDVEIHGSQEEPGVESSVGQEGGHHGSSEVRLFPDDLDRAGRDEADGREATFRSRVSSDLPGRSVQRLDPISCGRRFPERAGDSSLRTLPSSTLGSRHPGRPGDIPADPETKPSGSEKHPPVSKVVKEKPMVTPESLRSYMKDPGVPAPMPDDDEDLASWSRVEEVEENMIMMNQNVQQMGQRMLQIEQTMTQVLAYLQQQPNPAAKGE